MDFVLQRSLPLLGLLFAWLVLFVALRNKRLRNDARRDVQLALLNKFQTGEEITRFLATDEGRRLVDQLTAPLDDPRHRTIGLATGGAVLSSIGVALALCSKIVGEPDLLIAAVVIGAVGVGLFIGAAVAHRLSKGLSGKDD